MQKLNSNPARSPSPLLAQATVIIEDRAIDRFSQTSSLLNKHNKHTRNSCGKNYIDDGSLINSFGQLGYASLDNLFNQQGRVPDAKNGGFFAVRSQIDW